ncbi:MAG: protein translocase subunit SecF [Lactobacillus sp.]|jgi:preprotein translocase subunit SecF|nr:protein translocase subunit SecF [Lactobacillus sp.]
MIKIFNWVTKDTTINFMGARKLTYILSLIAIVISMVSIATRGFNYGIDFSGGILIEIRSEDKIDLDALRSKLSDIDLQDITLQSIGHEGTEVMIRAQALGMDEAEQKVAVEQIKDQLGSNIEYRRIESVGPQVGDELKMDGVIASIIAVLAISLYIWVRFEWQFALGAMIGLVHDILIVVGLISIFDIDFNLTTVAAVLTLAGYSVNDTVVTYDRIRENLRKFKKMPQIDLLNKSVNDIFSRTILTGLTTVLASGSLYLFGGDALRSFAFPLVWGILVGTYSSIYTSTAFLNLFDLRKTASEESVNPFGNV